MSHTHYKSTPVPLHMPTVWDNIITLCDQFIDSIADIYRSGNTFIICLLSFLILLIVVSSLILAYFICWEIFFVSSAKESENKLQSLKKSTYTDDVKKTDTKPEPKSKNPKKRKTD